ncbi:hypothetical protein [Azohydromonas lata]|uniref:hypothetical protein n=1 Tax=Azohydromonas lata TaxID=45677 RepID=UPI0012F505C4|nr:hypothetical protein [Azohydromonas lata]
MHTPTTRPKEEARSPLRLGALALGLAAAALFMAATTVRSPLAAPADAPAVPGDSLRANAAFTAHLLLTPDEPALRRAWAAAATAGTQPDLQATDRVAAGAGVGAVVILSGCAPDAAGRCDVAVEFALLAADGSRQALGSGSLWTQPPATPNFSLGSAALTLRTTPAQRGAQLRVLARVTDRVAHRTLELSAPLRVE